MTHPDHTIDTGNDSSGVLPVAVSYFTPMLAVDLLIETGTVSQMMLGDGGVLDPVQTALRGGFQSSLWARIRVDPGRRQASPQFRA